MIADRDTDAGMASADQRHRRPPPGRRPLGVVDRKVDRQRQEHPGHHAELDRVDRRALRPG